MASCSSSCGTLAPQYSGDTWTFEFIFRKRIDDPLDDSNPIYEAIPLFGSVIWLALKINKEDTDLSAALIHSVTVPNDTDAANGKVLFTVPSNKTAITPRVYAFGIQKTIAGVPPIVTTLATGKITVMADVIQQVV